MLIAGCRLSFSEVDLSVHKTPQGFTLIELSIVLVIIGLIVGGVLVGRDLIAASEVRAQVSQIEKYQTAVNTFKGKYGYLPGDIPGTEASKFGFVVTHGNGDSQITGENDDPAAFLGGETGLFWVDLSAAKLVDGNFSTLPNSSCCFPTSALTPTSSPGIGAYIPQAKIGRGNYVYMWSGGALTQVSDSYPGDGVNYFGISAVIYADSSWAGEAGSRTSIPVKMAYGIDAKIDDGLAQSGRVTAMYDALTGMGGPWSAGGAFDPQAGQLTNGAFATDFAPSFSAVAGSSTTCYDNSSSASGTPGIANTAQHYSIEINNGVNPNCALSIQLQ